MDIPSFSHQFSFEKSPDWTRTYAPGRELRAYAEHCVDKYGLRPKIRFGTKVLGARFDDDDSLWRLELDGGAEITGRFLINASGVLITPNLPDIDGVDSFAGLTMHTARWDHTQDLTGKRVAIIGTGASAVQVIPEIAPIVERLTVFQRTPIWCFPKPGRAVVADDAAADAAPRRPDDPAPAQPGLRRTHLHAARAVLHHQPDGQNMDKVGKSYLRKQVDDPEVREKLTPQYAVGCKRPGFHNTYLSTYNRDNVELVTEPIDKITGSGVATVDGETRDIDVLILATGFKVMDTDDMPTYPLTGSGGRTWHQHWDENRLQAYEGVAVPGFPNFFTVFGPYGYVGSSYFALIEAQTHHIVRCLKQASRRHARRVEVKQEANDRYFGEMLSKRHRQIFWQDSCRLANSYYFDKNGDVPLRPTTTAEAYWRSRRYPLDDYEFTA